MPKESLLRESVRETRETLQRLFDRYPHAAIVSAGLIIALVGVAVAFTHGGDKPVSTVVRADARSLLTAPTTPTTLGTTATTYAAAPVPTFPVLAGGVGYGGGHVSVPARTRQPPATTGGNPTGNTAGSGDRGTTTTDPGSTIAPTAFNPNRIAYVSGGETRTVNADGTDPQPVAASAYFPAWSPSHTTLAVASADSPGGALSLVSSSGTRQQLTPGSTKQGDGDSAASWSPGGQRLVFARIEMGGAEGYSSIWTINRDGSNLHRIAITSGCFNRDPTWSPDSIHIAFWSSRDHCGASGQPLTGDYELYVMDSDGANVRRLGTAPNSGSPSFSPDGSTIAFASDRNGSTAGFEIYTIKFSGANETRLTTSAGDDTDPTWSPDGSRLAFRSNRGAGGIYTMKPDGSDVRFLVAGTEPAWS